MNMRMAGAGPTDKLTSRRSGGSKQNINVISILGKSVINGYENAWIYVQTVK